MSVWWQIKATANRLGVPASDLPGALPRSGARIHRNPSPTGNVDRWDLERLNSGTRADHETNVFVHDASRRPRFAEHAWNHAQEWVQATMKVIEDCRVKTAARRAYSHPNAETDEPYQSLGR